MAFVKDGHFEIFKRDVETNHNALEERIDQLEDLIKKFNGGVTIEEVPDIEEVVEEPEVEEEEVEEVEEEVVEPEEEEEEVEEEEEIASEEVEEDDSSKKSTKK